MKICCLSTIFSHTEMASYLRTSTVAAVPDDFIRFCASKCVRLEVS